MMEPTSHLQSQTAVQVDADIRPAPATAVDVVVEALSSLGPERSLTTLGQLITDAAKTTMSAVDDAALTVRDTRPEQGSRSTTTAHTGELPVLVDALQHRYGGPSLDTAAGSGTGAVAMIHVDDLRTETRWPRFATAALAQTPLLSMVSYRLSVGHRDQDMLGSLNLYATKPHVLDPDTITAGQRLAAYTAVTLAHAREVERAANLEQALHSSRDIGAAIGILMTRHLLTRENAFQILVEASQRTNRKLRDLAREVIYTGAAP